MKIRPRPPARHSDPSHSTGQPHRTQQAPTDLTGSPRMVSQRRTIRAAFGSAADQDAHVEPEQNGQHGHGAWHVVQQAQATGPAQLETDDARWGRRAPPSAPVPGRVRQRAPFVVDPTTFATVDLGGAAWTQEHIGDLYDRMPYHMKDRYSSEFQQAMKARGGVPARYPELQDTPKADAKPASTAVRAGRKIIAATNALKASGGSSTDQETKPLVHDPQRDERIGAGAAKDVAATAIGGAVSIATGGVSGKVLSAGSVLASGSKIVQIKAILENAKTQFADSHQASGAAPLKQLIGALEAVMKSQWIETLGKGVGVVVPGAGSAAAAAAKSPEDLGTIAALAGEGHPLAREAAKVLGLEATGDAKHTYGGL